MKNLLWRLGVWTRPVAVAGLMAFAAPASAAVLFEDSFDSGTVSPAWESKQCCHWVEDGWMHVQDRDGWPRSSLSIAHDSDASWRNYKLSMQAQFVPGFVDHMFINLRTDGFDSASGVNEGAAYGLSISGARGWGLPGERNHITLERYDFRPGGVDRTPLADVSLVVPTSPMLIEATLIGGHIQLWIDHEKVIDVVDDNPLKFGGVGVGAIWEAEARFDNFRVSSIPEPSTLWMAGLGLAAIAGVMRRRSAG